MAPFASRRLKIMNITMNIASAEKTTNITITKRENAAAVTIMDITMNIASAVKTMNITITRMRTVSYTHLEALKTSLFQKENTEKGEK